jgi:hypothetical protein
MKADDHDLSRPGLMTVTLGLLLLLTGLAWILRFCVQDVRRQAIRYALEQTDPEVSPALTVADPSQHTWTALDDRQFDRYVRRSPTGP